MIPTVNKCGFSGRLSRDPELKEVGDKQVCNASMAVNNRVKRNGQYVDETLWLNLEAWGTQARFLATIKKGQGLSVEGPLFQDSYTSRDGESKTSNRLVCYTVLALAEISLDSEPRAATASRTSNKASDGLDFEDPNDDIPF